MQAAALCLPSAQRAAAQGSGSGDEPTDAPTFAAPSEAPTEATSGSTTTEAPSASPSAAPSGVPSSAPTASPSAAPTASTAPTNAPTDPPTTSNAPTLSTAPTHAPSRVGDRVRVVLTFNGTLSDVTTEDQDELKTMGTLAVRGDVPIMSCRHQQCLWLVPAKPLAAVGGCFGASACALPAFGTSTVVRCLCNLTSLRAACNTRVL
jgi:hypothetical protein